MRKVLLFSLLLVAGLVLSQFFNTAASNIVRLATMFTLAFIMIHVGYEFEIDKSRPRQYAWDYFVAFTAAAFPWIFCAAYFVFVLAPPELWSHPDQWKEALLQGRFSSPTSAGVLFSMLAAAGLGATWLFKKARVLAIFDDLDTILLMIPLKMMMVGLRWQLVVLVLVIIILLMLAWRYLHVLRWPITYPWVMTYSAAIVLASELIYLASKGIDVQVPIHLEVLLPAFVLGCMLARPAGADPHRDDSAAGAVPGPESEAEQAVSTLISAAFMVLVGLSMPPVRLEAAGAGSYLQFAGVAPDILAAKKSFPGWGMIAFHVVMVTLISNLGKMYPAFCYRREATLRERLGLAVGMFPRGEVGAGVLVISLSYGISGTALTVAVLSLALNLLLTGVFILIVKKLLNQPAPLPTPVSS